MNTDHPIAATLAQINRLDYVPGKLDRTAPPRIWLQIDTDSSNDDRDELWPGEDHVTWQDEEIGGLEIQYVRADLAHPSRGVVDDGLLQLIRDARHRICNDAPQFVDGALLPPKENPVYGPLLRRLDEADAALQAAALSSVSAAAVCRSISDCSTPNLCASVGTCKSCHVLPRNMRETFDKAALPAVPEGIADEMDAWADAKMSGQQSSRLDRTMVREWAKRLRGEA